MRNKDGNHGHSDTIILQTCLNNEFENNHIADASSSIWNANGIDEKNSSHDHSLGYEP